MIDLLETARTAIIAGVVSGAAFSLLIYFYLRRSYERRLKILSPLLSVIRQATERMSMTLNQDVRASYYDVKKNKRLRLEAVDEPIETPDDPSFPHIFSSDLWEAAELGSSIITISGSSSQGIAAWRFDIPIVSSSTGSVSGVLSFDSDSPLPDDVSSDFLESIVIGSSQQLYRDSDFTISGFWLEDQIDEETDEIELPSEDPDSDA